MLNLLVEWKEGSVLSKEDLMLENFGKRLTRARLLIRCMEEAVKSAESEFIYLEIGCCFQEVEGLSTFVAAKFISERYNGSGQVFSLDIDLQHIVDSTKIVERYEPSLLPLIQWIEGSSMGALPKALEAIDELHFALVDGGAGPADNLFEFLAIWTKRSDGGAIFVDDCTYLKPSTGYSGRRDFGKAQMSLPFLMTVEHPNFVKRVIKNRTGEGDIEAQIESMLQITGGRLKSVRSHVEDDDLFCLTYGDGVGDIDVCEAIAFHRSPGKKATLTGTMPPGRFGALNLEGDSVTHFKGKPRGDGRRVNGGFFVLHPSVIDLIDGDETTWEQEPMIELANQGELMAFRPDGFWQPMDNVRDMRDLNRLWEDDKAPRKMWA